MTRPEDLLDPEIAPSVAFLTLDGPGGVDLALLRTKLPRPELSGRTELADHEVPGAPPVPVRSYRPQGATGNLPCVLSIHGGGYVMGSYDMCDAMFDRLCPELGVMGVAVEYRLAPETPYPGPLEDCYRALVWTYEHADELGVDRERLGVQGVSAGGGLAAGLALLARDRGEVPLAFQLLDCPMLDDRQQTWSSQLDGLPVWSRELNRFGWQSYLGELYGAADVPYHAAPARAGDLSGLPPAFVSVGSVDGFLDEDVDYALRLLRAEVPTELHVYPGAPHGYQIAFESSIARQSRRDVEAWLARQVRR